MRRKFIKCKPKSKSRFLPRNVSHTFLNQYCTKYIHDKATIFFTSGPQMFCAEIKKKKMCIKLILWLLGAAKAPIFVRLVMSVTKKMPILPF